jgi:hypothetical protein
VLIVPRGTILAERESPGAVCCMCFVFSGLDLRVIYGFCALLQRMGVGVRRRCSVGIGESHFCRKERVRGGALLSVIGQENARTWLGPRRFRMCEKQIPSGNDRQKSKCKSRSFAALRMTSILGEWRSWWTGSVRWPKDWSGWDVLWMVRAAYASVSDDDYQSKRSK